MYTPKINQMTDHSEILEFMRAFSFGTIVTAKDNLPVATHLPFVVTLREDNIILTSHFARANEQWNHIENNDVLVVFSGPHAYISPAHYERELNVPTWNYISVHAYGQGTLISGVEEVFEVLKSTINNYEKSYIKQWEGLPEDYKLKMSKGIVAFEISVYKIDAKKKLSQNKTPNEQRNIVNALSKSSDTNETLIATFMRNEL